jgi:hypothetical protein
MRRLSQREEKGEGFVWFNPQLLPSFLLGCAPFFVLGGHDVARNEIPNQLRHLHRLLLHPLHLA